MNLDFMHKSSKSLSGNVRREEPSFKHALSFASSNLINHLEPFCTLSESGFSGSTLGSGCGSASGDVFSLVVRCVEDPRVAVRVDRRAETLR